VDKGLAGAAELSGKRFQALVDQVASRSYVRVLPDGERAAFLAEVAAFAGTLEEPIMMPYNTQLFTAAVPN
jgi:hypothetical protein